MARKFTRTLEIARGISGDGSAKDGQLRPTCFMNVTRS